MQIDFFLIRSFDEVQAAVVTKSSPLSVNHDLHRHLTSLMSLTPMSLLSLKSNEYYTVVRGKQPRMLKQRAVINGFRPHLTAGQSIAFSQKLTQLKHYSVNKLSFSKYTKQNCKSHHWRLGFRSGPFVNIVNFL